MIVSDSYIRGMVLVGFADFVRSLGGDPEAILAEADIDPAALTSLDRLISYRKTGHMLEIAAARLNRPAFGIEWARSLQPHFSNMGPVLMLALFTRDVREWIGLALKYWRYHCNGFTIQIIEEGDLVRGRYIADSFAFPSRQQVEHIFANVALGGQQIVGHHDIYPVAVRFRHSAPKDAAPHGEVFKCPVEFNADHDEFVSRRSVLSHSTGGNLRLLRPLVEYFVRYRIDRMPAYDQTMTTTVALAIPGVIGTGKLSAEFVAGILGMNAKKMQRLLAAEETTFSDILDKVRENMARQILKDSDAPVSRIAGLLDYSGTAPFTIAFKRWSGQSPIRYRKTVRQRVATSPAAGDK